MSLWDKKKIHLSFNEFNLPVVQVSKWRAVWLCCPWCGLSLPSISSKPFSLPRFCSLGLEISVLRSVLVSYCWHNKLPWTWWLTITWVYYLTVQEKFEIGPGGLKSRYQQVWIPFGGSRREFISLFFPASRGCLHFLAYSSLPSSKPTMAGWVFLMLHHSDTESPASLFYL